MRFNCGDFNNSIILLNLQEPHQECIGEDKLLFAKGEFNMNKLFVLTTML